MTPTCPGVNQERIGSGGGVALVLSALKEYPSDTGVLNPTLLALKALTQKHGKWNVRVK